MPDEPFTYDLATPIGKVRLLVNDVEVSTAVFTDSEITSFLGLEGGNVKCAAALAIETNADNEALASKVLRDKDQSTDGAALSRALRERAASLRAQARLADSEDDEGFFMLVPGRARCRPELTEWPRGC